jgi:hypothetical protein
MSWKLLIPALAVPAILAAGSLPAGRAAERALVERAVLDYVESLYRVDPSLVDRSVHPDLAKRGFWRPAPDAGYQERTMSFGELRDLAAVWNREGQVDPAVAVKQVVVFDVLDRTASAKLIADWGVDYLHLARYADGWKVVNVLWQSAPPDEYAESDAGCHVDAP